MPAHDPIPLDAPLAAISTVDDLNQAQWDIILAICDAIIPAIQPAAFSSNHGKSASHALDEQQSLIVSDFQSFKAQKNITQEYLQEIPSAIPEFRDLLRRTLLDGLSSTDKTQLLRVLNLLR